MKLKLTKVVDRYGEQMMRLEKKEEDEGRIIFYGQMVTRVEEKKNEEGKPYEVASWGPVIISIPSGILISANEVEVDIKP